MLGNHAKERFRIETNKTYGYIDRMCSRATKPDDLKICCPIWAVDCNEDDYYFEHGLERDCAPQPWQCKHYECRDVSHKLQSMEDEYRNFRTDASDTLAERLRKDSDAGVTGHGRVCSCSCGELVDEDKLTCKVVTLGISSFAEFVVSAAFCTLHICRPLKARFFRGCFVQSVCLCSFVEQLY